MSMASVCPAGGAHWWRIAAFTGQPTSPGRCRKCGAVREFNNKLPVYYQTSVQCHSEPPMEAVPLASVLKSRAFWQECVGRHSAAERA